MKKESFVYGSPWKTIAKFLTYTEADRLRNKLIEDSVEFNFKVKFKNSENLFLVKRRIKNEVLQNRSGRSRNKKDKKPLHEEG